jgi:hypothetical protein
MHFDDEFAFGRREIRGEDFGRLCGRERRVELLGRVVGC